MNIKEKEMPFIQLPGEQGMIWEPEQSQDKKKNCKDCFACQFCSDSRCALCLKNKECKKDEQV